MTRTVAILVFPDFQLLDAAGPLSVFETGGNCAAASQAYRLRVIARGPIWLASGLRQLVRSEAS
jgi:transcriptional regulator GlxA family with amidase domain